MDPIAEINQDVKVLKDVSTGSDAFTFLCLKNDQLIYRKIATQESGGVDKLNLQLNWLLEHQQYLPLPKIGNHFYDGEVCWYDMYANMGCSSMFGYIESNPLENSWQLLYGALESIKNLYTVNLRDADKGSIINYIVSKVSGSAKKILTDGGQYLSALQKYPNLVINGKTYKNFNYYFGDNGILTKDKLLQIFVNDKCSDIHGDLTLENMICDGKSQSVYFIDPNLGNPHETCLLDYAKLLQSLHGNYEYLQKIKDVKINHNQIDFDLSESQVHAKIYHLYDEYLKNTFSAEDYKSIYYHEIVHWLRLLPYKIRKDSRRAVIYFCETLILLDELERKFGSQK